MREDWIECKFDDVFFTTSGGTPSRRNENYYIGDIPWIKSGELKSNVITEAEEFISEEAIKNSSAKVFPTGTILLALYGATIGKIAILGIPAATNQAICGIFETPFVFNKYAYYYLVNKKSYLIKQGIGGAQPNISQTILKNLDFSLPPFPEQRAIVKKLESLFSSLDAGVADLNKAQQQLKIYRQAVLKKAFEGELTREWREKNNVNNSWSTFSFKDIADVISGKNQKEVEVADGKYPIYGSGGIIGRASKFICEEGTTIVGRKGTINSPIYVKEKFWNIDTAFGLKSKSDVDDKLFYFWCLSYNFKQLDKSTTIPSLAKRDIELILINLTKNQLEQHQIVKQIESRLSVCDSIEQNIKESLVKAEALRQSILKKAFEGSLLTAQELAECKQAADYEPASVLLKKIKSENEANKLVDRTIKIKPKIKMDKKEILVLLMENNSEMPVDQLWKDSVYTNDIDAFYLKLKELSEQGKIEEVKNGKKVTIKLI